MIVKKWIWLLLAGVFILPLTLEAAQVGEKMPAFEIQTLDGKVLNSSDIVGKQPVLLVFWATWCPACKEEIPYINEMAEEFGPKGMLFLGVNVGVNDSAKKVLRYAEKYQMRYPLYFDKGSKLTRKFKVAGTPTVILVDKSGIIRYRDVAPPPDLLTHFDDLNK